MADVDISPEFTFGTGMVFTRGLNGYVSAVAARLGVGWESCTVDAGLPASAYIALDARVPGFGDRDVALLWTEGPGWSVAVEANRGAELLVLGCLAADPVPAPDVVAAFVRRFLADGTGTSVAVPPTDRPVSRAGTQALLTAYAGWERN
jgi:hypothetical protein